MDKLLDNAPCGFLAAKDNGEIVQVNKTLLEMLGFESKEKIVGGHIEKILSAGGRIFYQTHIFPLLKMHGQALEIYLDLKSKQNGSIPVLLNAGRRSEDNEEALNTYVFIPFRQRNKFEDELLLAKKEAEAANRAKDEFLSIVSHELRTPLNAMLGWVQILEKNSGDPEMLEKGLKIIQRNARMQKTLVEDLLDASRVITGKLRLEINDRTNIEKVVNTAIDALSPAMNKKKITLTKNIEPLPKIAADPERLQQVFWNLLNNAVKFTSKGGKIEVTARIKDSELEFCVSDTGQGISKDFLPQIFIPFKQKDVSESRRHGGLGLGLAITQQIVELHGGTIRAESEGEGRGAKFIVSLPL